ncbi:MAG: adenylosuccinate lyase [bacterium]
MIERYTLPEMGRIWSEENKFRKWLDVEIAACEAWAESGKIPADAVENIRKKAAFSVKRINEIEQKVDHDVIAFLTNIGENVGDDARYIHMGLTSSDVLDTATALLLKESADLILKELKELATVLRERAAEHKHTIMIGRTHGIHAEPTTFGLKLLLWHAEMMRNIHRVRHAQEAISVGKISGPVGTYSNVPPDVEEKTCRRLGIKPAPVSTQVIQRDRHAEFMSSLAITAATIEKIAVEIRHLQRTEVLEAEEFFAPEQKGSSAMPHKRNPILSERLAGLARIIRANALTALENIALWHERDISHSSVERVIFPDSCILIHYMLVKTKNLVKKLLVYPEQMKENINRTRGLIFSQRVLLALTDKGVPRENAYQIVQRNAMEAWKGGGDFRELLRKDDEIKKHLSSSEIDECFDLSYYLRHVDKIFERFGI